MTLWRYWPAPAAIIGRRGQPILDGVEMADVRYSRLYKLDEQRPLRFSHDNRESKLYAEYMGVALGEKAISCCIPIIDVKSFLQKLTAARSGTV